MFSHGASAWLLLFLRNALSTAANSMTTALTGPLRNQLSEKKRRGREFWIHALEASNALNYSAWGIPAKSQPYWAYGPIPAF